MRTFRILAALVLVASAAGAQTFNATLAGGRETGGGGDPAGKGLAVVTFSGTTVMYYIWVRDIAQPTAAHIHSALAGQAGSIVVSLNPTFSSPTTGVYVAHGSVTSDSTTVGAIFQQPNAYYVNVHNAAFPDGAVRGQLLGDGGSEFAFASTLTGARVPGGGDPAGTGYATAILDGSTVYYYMWVNGIASPTAAQINNGTVGQTGPVAVNLSPTFTNGVASGGVATSASTIAAIIAHPNDYYFNVSNGAFPNGALRGQLLPTERDIYFPVVARNPGLGTSLFKTDLRIVSLTDEAATVYAEWYPHGAGSAGPATVTQISVSPRGEAVIDDAVSVLFGANDRGAMRLLSAFPIRAVVHNFNDQRSAGTGTFGLSLDGLFYDGALTSGLLVFNSHRPKADRLDFRTNIGYFNPNPFPVTVTFNVRKPDGTLVGEPGTRTIPGWANDQGFFYQTIPGVPADQQTLANFYVTFTASKPIFMFSAVVDNLTDDAFQQAAQPVSAGLTAGSSAPPTATITNPTGDVTVTTGQAVAFVGSGSDPGGLTLTGHWDFGDSVSADGLSVTHTYAAAGTYTVKFTVTNSQGLTSAPDQRTVTVTAAATATLSAIQVQIFTPICSSCHPPNQEMDLRSGKAFASIVGKSSSEQPLLQRVKPGDPTNSYLYMKITGASGISGARMPFGGQPLSAAQIQLIHDWILAGAQNN
ncbi:MAG TPA: CHRD domain-containing protein [Thermoanaerobaculaceae bacterium]|nr:CHRD domain-containing protein [Thermoanaerobaculaceae bacterium]